MTFSDLVAPRKGPVAPKRVVSKFGFQHLAVGPLI